VQTLRRASRRGNQKDRTGAQVDVFSKPGGPAAITHHSKLDQIEAAFAAIGKRLAIDVLCAAADASLKLT
jgi:hypothetical protein